MVNGVVASKSQVDGDIVDEARRPDHRGRDQPHRTARLVERLERQRIDQARHNRSGKSRRLQPLLRAASDLATGAPDQNAALRPSFSARGSSTARSRSSADKVGVARRQSEAVLVADGRHAEDLDAELEVLSHPPDDRELLEILFAEQGDVGPNRAQQFGDDRRDPVEMAGPRLAFPAIAERPSR